MKTRSRYVVAALAAATLPLPLTARADLAYLNSFAPGIAGTFDPVDIGTGASGQVIVSDASDAKVNVYAPDGTFQFPLVATNVAPLVDFGFPAYGAIGPDGDIYVADSERNAILIFSSTGQEVRTIQTTNFETAQGMAISANGTIFLVSGPYAQADNNVYAYTTAGQSLYNFAAQSGTATGLASAQGLAIDSTATNIFVANTGANVVSVFSPNGNFEYNIGGSAGPGLLKSPASVSVSGTGLVYVTDANAGVKVYTESGTYLETVALTANGQSFNPDTVAVSPEGMVYVDDSHVTAVYRYFDPASWASGTNTFTNANTGPTSVTIGAGGLLGSTLTLSASKGLVVGGTTTVNDGGLLNMTGGGLNTGSLVVDGTTNGANFALTSGSLTTSTISVINGGVADLAGSGLVFTLSGGISVSGASSQFKVDQGALISAPSLANTGQVIAGVGADLIVYNAVTNGGAVNLAGGELDVRGTLTNSASQTIQGFGTLSTTGGLINNGTLALAGSSSVIGSVSNTATLHLSGTTPNVFFGPVNNTGTLTVDAGANGTLYGAYSGGGSIMNNGSLYVNATSVAGPVSGGGTLTIGAVGTAANLMLLSGGVINSQSSLTINPGSSLNITNNLLTINFPAGNDPAATIRGYLVSGYNGDKWNGPGIVSSIAAANPGLYAVGYADGNTDPGTPAAANQIYIKNTLAGDANLDGIVNFPDLLVVAQNYGKTGVDWAHGDFNYDGVVNFPDLLLVAQNYGKQLSAGELAQLPQSFIDEWQLAQAEIASSDAKAVPDPASLSLIAVGAAAVLFRRRISRRQHD